MISSVFDKEGGLRIPDPPTLAFLNFLAAFFRCSSFFPMFSFAID